MSTDQELFDRWYRSFRSILYNIENEEYENSTRSKDLQEVSEVIGYMNLLTGRNVLNVLDIYPNVSGCIGTPLISAIFRGDHELIQIFLDHGADPNLSSSRRYAGYTPLDAAVHVDDHDAIEALLYAGANRMHHPITQSPKEIERWNRTWDLIKSRENYVPEVPSHQEVKEEFEKASASEVRITIEKASASGVRSTPERISKLNLPESKMSVPRFRNASALFPLIYRILATIELGNLDLPSRRDIEINELIQDVEHFNKVLQNIPNVELQYPSVHGNVLNFHLRSIRTHDNTTPLISAIRRNDPELVQVILDLGADPNLSSFPGHNSLGETPLDVAINMNNPQIIGALLDAGATQLNYPLSNNPEELERRNRIKEAIAAQQHYAPGAPGYQEAEEEFERIRR